MTALLIDSPATTTTNDDLDHFFLGRLATLVTRQAASASPSERAALAQSAFALLLDCVDLVLGAEAQTMLAQLRDEPPPLDRAVA